MKLHVWNGIKYRNSLQFEPIENADEIKVFSYNMVTPEILLREWQQNHRAQSNMSGNVLMLHRRYLRFVKLSCSLWAYNVRSFQRLHVVLTSDNNATNCGIRRNATYHSNCKCWWLRGRRRTALLPYHNYRRDPANNIRLKVASIKIHKWLYNASQHKQLLHLPSLDQNFSGN